MILYLLVAFMLQISETIFRLWFWLSSVSVIRKKYSAFSNFETGLISLADLDGRQMLYDFVCGNLSPLDCLLHIFFWNPASWVCGRMELSNPHMLSEWNGAFSPLTQIVLPQPLIMPLVLLWLFLWKIFKLLFFILLSFIYIWCIHQEMFLLGMWCVWMYCMIF